jgi:hypothetical protein
VTAAPPLNLLDEQFRLVLVAACEALAAAPGELYPVVYVGPLRSPDLLLRAACEAAQAFGVGLSLWARDETPEDGAFLLVCPLDAATDARLRVDGRAGVQLIVWGDAPADELPQDIRSAVCGPADLAIDPREQILPRGEAAWLGGSVERLVADAGGPANPLVVVCARDTLRLCADEAQMHLDAAGVAPVEVVPGSGPVPATGKRRGIVATLRGDGPAGSFAALADLCVACRSGTSPLVVVTDTFGWDRLRTLPAWTAQVGACTVVRAGDGSPDPLLGELPWPAVPDLWVGAPAGAAPSDAEALLLPDGTSLLEGLAHVEVRGRAGRLVAWTPERVAVVDLAVRPSGTVVVGSSVVGSGDARDRESVLAQLDSIRAWYRLSLAMLGPDPAAAVREVAEEPVQRVGFYFSRLDDERASATSCPAAGGVLSLHDVARALLDHGLARAARALLRRAERESRWGVDEEMLLSFLVAEGDPEEAITRLRHAALRLATAEDDSPDGWALQTDATLNALLLMVRARQIGAADAWASVESWLRAASTMWVSTARHAGILFELAARAGHAGEARTFAELFREMAGPDEPLSRTLAPAFHALLGEDR